MARIELIPTAHTSRYERWLRAFAAERRAARELGEAYMRVRELDPMEQYRPRQAARRIMMRANAAHCKTMERERASRARMSRADLACAVEYATTVWKDA